MFRESETAESRLSGHGRGRLGPLWFVQVIGPQATDDPGTWPTDGGAAGAAGAAGGDDVCRGGRR